ncbi:MAG: hypothetical protein IJF67_05495 [Clostridia bacterium]|nr:hypothetical protein [Clostridia bacterium]
MVLPLSGVQYMAIGDLSITTLDLTFILLFNKQLIKDYQLDSPYALVNSGSWTFDAMFDMMKTATRDLDGDTKMTENDAYGYTASAKQVLPNFWIAAGELSVKKDKADLPYLALNEERFIDVFNRIFEITYDDNTRYAETTMNDVPDSSLRLFNENRSLFMDCSFFFVEALRDMDTDFGIIPYPKFNEEQDRYYSRVSYYNAPIVSVASTELDLIGAVLEYMNYESRKTVIPAYYEIALKGKYSRDEESLEMLDLINDSRVVDIGDTTLCSTIRDGFMRAMYLKNDRNLASNTASASTVITNLIDKLPK